MSHSPQESNTKESFYNQNKDYTTAQSIIRCKHNRVNPYVQINKNAIWDQNLSLNAVGLLVRILSRPDNWVFKVSEIIKHSKEGKQVIYNTINELISNGYALRFQHRIKNSNNHWEWGKTEYYFFEFKLSPEEIKKYTDEFKKCLPHSAFGETQVEDPQNEEALLIKEEELNKDLTNKEEESEVQRTDSSQASESLSANASKASNKIPKIKKYENLEELEKLLNYMTNKIRLIDPEFKVSNTKTWLKGFDAILRIDKRKYENVIVLMDYIYEHDFWKTNILSPQKLRIQFTRLIAEQAVKCSADKIAFKRKVVFDVLKEMKSSLKENIIINKEFIHNSLTNEKLYFNLQLKDFIAKLERLLNCEISLTKHEEETYG